MDGVSDHFAANAALASRIERAKVARIAAQDEFVAAILAAIDGGMRKVDIARAAGLHRSRIDQIEKARH
jgi:hypothetical protein